MEIGEFRVAQGVVSHYAQGTQHTGGYRILPRFAVDVNAPPPFLPVTGT